MSDRQSPESPMLKWGAFLTPIIIAIVAVVVGYARIEPKIEANAAESLRIRGDFIEHRESPAHNASALDQARLSGRVDGLDRDLDGIKTQLDRMERKQDALCAESAACRRQLLKD